MKQTIRNAVEQVVRYPYQYSYLVWVALVGYMIFVIQPEWLPYLTAQGWSIAWYVFLVVPTIFILINLEHNALAIIAIGPLVVILVALILAAILSINNDGQVFVVNLEQLIK